MKKSHWFFCLLRLFFGSLFMMLPGFALYLQEGYESVATAGFFGGLFCFGVRWVILGLVGFFRPLPARGKTYGAALGGTVLLAMAGPSVSRSYHVSREPGVWAEVSASKDPHRWREDYIKSIPEPYRRKDWLSRYGEARCARALDANDLKELRTLSQEAFVSQATQYDDQARKAIGQAYFEVFQKGLAAVKPTKLADPKLSAALQAVLKSLSEKPTRHIYLHFQCQGVPGKIPQDAEFLASLADPKAAKLPIQAVGDAFAATAQARRAQAARDAIQASLDQVCPKDLIALELAPKEASPDDVNFSVSAQVRRLPGFYVNSENNVMESLLYKVEVAWSFKVEVAGQEAGRFEFRSEPAKHVAYRTSDKDPDWAAYSIVMDSATDNFSRLVVGRLGLQPPPERTDPYQFSK